MLSAGCAHVGPSRAHVEPSWAHLGLMLGQVGPSFAAFKLLERCFRFSSVVAPSFLPIWHCFSGALPLGSLESADIHNSNSTFDLPEAIVEYVWKNLVPELCEITYFFRLGHDGQ